MSSSRNKDQLKRQRPPFTLLEDKILEDERISKHGLLVYWILCRHADNQAQCFPSMTRIGKQARISRSTAWEAIEELITAGYISRQKRKVPGKQEKSSNLYTILYRCSHTEHVVRPPNTGCSHTELELDPLLTRSNEVIIPPPPEPAQNSVKKKQKKGETDPRIKGLIDYFAQSFEIRVGNPPTVSGGRWGSNIKVLLRNHSADTIKAVIDCFFNYNGRTRFSWSAFYDTFDNLLPRVAKQRVRRDKV